VVKIFFCSLQHQDRVLGPIQLYVQWLILGPVLARSCVFTSTSSHVATGCCAVTETIWLSPCGYIRTIHYMLHVDIRLLWPNANI